MEEGYPLLTQVEGSGDKSAFPLYDFDGKIGGGIEGESTAVLY